MITRMNSVISYTRNRPYREAQLTMEFEQRASAQLKTVLLNILGGPARVNSDKRHGPKSSDSA